MTSKATVSEILAGVFALGMTVSPAAMAAGVDRADVQHDVDRLNSLQIIDVKGLKEFTSSNHYCYGRPCPGDSDAVNEERAAKLKKIADFAETL